jgi:hypothetical protein
VLLHLPPPPTHTMFENVEWTDIALIFLVGVVFGIAALYYIQSLAQKIDRKLEDARTPPPTQLSPLNTTHPNRRRPPRRDNNEVVFPYQSVSQDPRHAPSFQTTTLPPVIPTVTHRTYTQDTHNPMGTAPENHDDPDGGPSPQKKRQTKIMNKKDTTDINANCINDGMSVIHEETQEDGSVATVISSFGGGGTSRRSSLALDLDVNMGLDHQQQDDHQQQQDQSPNSGSRPEGTKRGERSSVRSSRRGSVNNSANNSASNSGGRPHGDEDNAPKTRAQTQTKARAAAPARKPRKPSTRAVEPVEEDHVHTPSTPSGSTLHEGDVHEGNMHEDDVDEDGAEGAWVPRTTRRSTKRAQQQTVHNK